MLIACAFPSSPHQPFEDRRNFTLCHNNDDFIIDSALGFKTNDEGYWYLKYEYRRRKVLRLKSFILIVITC